MKILIAEDDPVSRRILETTLVKWEHETVVCCDGLEAQKALHGDDAPQLAILDWEMPGMDGIQVCQEVRKRGKEPYTYIIMLTARKQKEDVVTGLEMGADDYITKPFDKDELRVRLRAGIRIIELQSELISARESLHEQATHDSLTGLWNHEAIFEILQKDLNHAKRENISVGILMADLDFFKRVNDTYGHLTGDTILRETARRLLNTARIYDSVGRYGGEEFLIILPGCTKTSVMNMAERLCASIREKAVLVPEGTIPITISVGAAVSGDLKGEKAISREDVEFFIQAADKALYQAKENGRNRVELAPCA